MKGFGTGSVTVASAAALVVLSLMFFAQQIWGNVLCVVRLVSCLVP